MPTPDSTPTGGKATPPSPDTSSLSRPGALLEPLGWMGPRVFDMVCRDPALAPRLLALDNDQLHLLAVALANDPDDRQRAVIAATLGAPMRDVLPALGLGALTGHLDRLLPNLPANVLAERGYQGLVRLLADPVAAEILHRELLFNETFLENLAALPAPLLTFPIATALDRTPGAGRDLPDWIALVANRRGDDDARPVTERLVTAPSSKELHARMSNLIECLPETDSLPPSTIAGARRLDSPAEIRWMARILSVHPQHCFEAAALRTALWYRLPAARMPLVCELRHVPRYGWLFDRFVAGHHHVPDLDFLLQVQSAFKSEGFPCRRLADLGGNMLSNLDAAILMRQR